MDNITFVPQSQKNLDELNGIHSNKKGDNLIFVLVILFIIYTTIVLGVYWFFVVRERARIDEAIQELDSINSQYYISSDLDQGLFNVSDLINKFYNPITAIKEIESAYVPGSSVSSFNYSKIDKIINISMKVPSINNVTEQIERFNKLNSVKSSSYSALSSDDRGVGFSFGIEIILK